MTPCEEPDWEYDPDSSPPDEEWIETEWEDEDDREGEGDEDE